MPIYEYRCQGCGHQLEALQKITDAELTDCPECALPELKKLMSAAGFRLKGGGWYETDFKKDNQRNLHEGAGKGGEDKGEDKKGKDKKDSGKGDKTTAAERSGSGAEKSSKSNTNQPASAA